MGSTLIIKYSPRLDFAPGIIQRHKPVLVQTLLPQPAVEGFHCGIICRFTWSGEIDFYLAFVNPLIEHFTGEFTAVIGFEHQRQWAA